MGMTVKERETEQLDGIAAELANTARAQVKAWLDKLDVLRREGEDLLVDMDARLEDFDATSRRLEQTTAEKRETNQRQR